ncbi:MAG: RDD family protein [Pseudomonadales bacterium]|nr:RDD family protein [Pseudomonadales bacterium]
MSQASSTGVIAAAPAGLSRRLGALLYDVLLIIALWMVTVLVAVLLNSGEAVTGLFMQLVFFLEPILFYGYFWLRQGQTLGMKAWRLKLVDTDGQDPTMGQVIKRMLMGPLSLICLGLGYAWYFVGTRQQTWHDRFSNTYVVLLPKES